MMERLVKGFGWAINKKRTFICEACKRLTKPKPFKSCLECRKLCRDSYSQYYYQKNKDEIRLKAQRNKDRAKLLRFERENKQAYNDLNLISGKQFEQLR